MSGLNFKLQVKQIHFGGGTPNYLELSDWDNLFHFLKEQFTFLEDIECSVELDPMHLNSKYIKHLKKLGFNRISLGIQDINSPTLNSVNRPQDIDLLNTVVDNIKELNLILST